MLRSQMTYNFLKDSIWHPPLAFEEVANPKLPPEIELQALWFSGAFGRDFRLKNGRNLRITQFGEWNHGAGPDFARAAIEIDGSQFSGDLEIDSRPSDWENHGHAANPAFSNTILHVTFEPPPKETFIRTVNHRQIPELLISPSQLADALNLPARRTAISIPGRCIQPLRKMPKLAIDRLLKEAAMHRAEVKAGRFLRTAEAHGREAALFQCTTETLGYSNNTLPMQLLAQHAPITMLRKSRINAESILLGTAGFMETRSDRQAPEDTRDYLLNLWETWWRIRANHELTAVNSFAWKTSGQRPANHPHRRVGGLSSLIEQWPEFSKLAFAENFQTKPIIDFLQNLKHGFWSFHHTLTSHRTAKPISVYGKSLALELIANHLIPLAISEGRYTYDQYYKLRHSAVNQKLKRCSIRLFGSEEAAKTHLRRIANQQAMLQLYQDFCLEDFSNCEQCPFPEQLAQWR